MPDKKSLKKIFGTLEIEGVHLWKNCDIKEVSYLKNLHRHIFHVRAVKKVSHSDRDIEFINLKHQIKNHISDKYYSPFMELNNFNEMSCEMIAEELISKFDLCLCEVSEDGENGSIIEVI